MGDQNADCQNFNATAEDRPGEINKGGSEIDLMCEETDSRELYL